MWESILTAGDCFEKFENTLLHIYLYFLQFQPEIQKIQLSNVNNLSMVLSKFFGRLIRRVCVLLGRWGKLQWLRLMCKDESSKADGEKWNGVLFTRSLDKCGNPLWLVVLLNEKNGSAGKLDLLVLKLGLNDEFSSNVSSASFKLKRVGISLLFKVKNNDFSNHMCVSL